MNVPIFIRSYWKDAPWLEYCLRSLKKFASGFSEIVVVAPTRDQDTFFPIAERYGCRLHQYIVNEDKPMIHGEILVCQADLICPKADYIFFVDSDCAACQPFTVFDYFADGKPILVGRKFARMKNSRSETERCMYKQWLPATEAALGFTPEYETNMRVPSIFRRETFAPFRAAVEKHVGKPFQEYAFSCRNEYPQTFIEFTPIGNYILRYTPELYYFADMEETSGPHNIQRYADSGEHLWTYKFKQYWSHGGLTPAIQKELEAICA